LKERSKIILTPLDRSASRYSFWVRHPESTWFVFPWFSAAHLVSPPSLGRYVSHTPRTYLHCSIRPCLLWDTTCAAPSTKTINMTIKTTPYRSVFLMNTLRIEKNNRFHPTDSIHRDYGYECHCGLPGVPRFIWVMVSSVISGPDGKREIHQISNVIIVVKIDVCSLSFNYKIVLKTLMEYGKLFSKSTLVFPGTPHLYICLTFFLSFCQIQDKFWEDLSKVQKFKDWIGFRV
jgi:hypothetical protein